MIDLFALALTHGLLLLMGLRLAMRDDLDADPPPPSLPQDDGPEESAAP
ncbi:hypothetical protein [Tsuneonella suprasediminis]|nr:hypothetical protein [Tsuneonella suprasediminis]UBS33563.1 hypothetical protein LBX01_02745 [Altererythrobacter sp. N1]